MDVTADQANLARATRLAGRATPTRSTLPVLQTVRLDAQPGRLGLTATDLELGLTTAIAANVATPGTACVPARLPGVTADPQQILVPARAVSELARLLGDADAVRLIPTAENRGAHFVVGETALFGRVIEGRFPDVERVIPADGKTRVTVETAA